MTCINMEHFKELLRNLTGETIKEIYADMRYVKDNKGGFRLPEPKNDSERIAMEKFRKQSQLYVFEEFLNRPRIFQHLPE